MTTNHPPRLFAALVLCGAALVPGCERTASTPPTADPPSPAPSAAPEPRPHADASHDASPTSPPAVVADAREAAPACECSEAKDASCTGNGVLCCWATDPCCEPCC